MAEISDDDLGLLVACAVDYNARLPYGVVPGRIWSLLTPEWQRRVTEQMDETCEPAATRTGDLLRVRQEPRPLWAAAERALAEGRLKPLPRMPSVRPESDYEMHLPEEGA